MVAFALASLALIMKPGPDLMCLLATALAEGRLRAFALMCGQMLGCWFWIILLSLGVASFFSAHPSVMTAVQVVGVCYIGYLAFLTLREAVGGLRSGERNEFRAARASAPALFVRGIAMAMSNPLTILFFLAFLPTFTRGDSSLSPGVQTLFLGTVFCALVPLFDIPLVFAADAFRARILGNPRLAPVLKLVSGLVLSAVVVVLLWPVLSGR